MNRLTDFIISSQRRLAMPLAVYPGKEITGVTVGDIVTDAEKQYNVQKEIHARYGTWVVQSAMDLSVEAEAFGSDVHITEHEIPTVRGRLVSCEEEIRALRVPEPGEKRTRVYIDTVRYLAKLDTNPFVLAGMIGPFSLAGRLFGVTESLELTMTGPDIMRELTGKSADFLIAYARAFKNAGADGILIAEPSAGLLSPRSLAEFSSDYIGKINDAVGDDDFCVILHNCAARINHLPALLESGVSVLHIGDPMDIVKALKSVPETTVLCGNLDPAGVFLNSTEEEIFNKTKVLLHSTGDFKNFVISSGCDVPPGVAMSKLDAFYRANHRV